MATANSSVEYRDLAPFGLPGYRVGDDGSLWTRRIQGTREDRFSKDWRRLTLSCDSRGYHRVNLKVPLPDGYLPGLTMRSAFSIFQAHRLVLEVFVGPCPPGMQVRHLNGIKTDNRLENLIWGTHEENCQDNRDLGAYHKGERHHRAKLTEADVRDIRRRYAAGGVTLDELAAEFGVGMANIYMITSRRSWKHVDDQVTPVAHDRGERHPRAKLTEADVRAIRVRYAAGGVTQKRLADEFGVTESNIKLIIDRKSWNHVE